MQEVVQDRPVPSELNVDDGDYEVYLFWPSLRLQESPNSGNEHSIYGVRLGVPFGRSNTYSRSSQQPVLPSFDFDDYWDGLASPPALPLSFSETTNYRFPNGKRMISEPEREPVQTGYSQLVKMGLLFSQQVSHSLDCVWDKVRVILQKAKRSPG
ncbi:hypothetical protein HETIRDRAFT_414773 [Heterobasidion irregulare TC 32-1]|uniref:Uncharacterized protein n=1 Tax=Heterobasidion irregulare (strain TC 32-1) TaxID=747525 RepID=W4KL81_HETIT|nr:uncharacterized protein HETIRDRAFT_414773 [Heterobasidion irregulare TC 32-1]ETW85791.1 hypothetical protein HETIRDRAFT_414773 [Heterobasidion irregulare TC 32-1]